jgi:hypothetical protein
MRCRQACVVVLFAFAFTRAGSGQAGRSQAPRLAVPSWAGTVICRGGDGTIATSVGDAGREMALDCRIDDRLSCDSDEVEPLDVARSSVCSTHRLDVRPASNRAVSTQAAGELDIEWLGPGRGGLEIVARRKIASNGTAMIPIATDALRWIRINRAGASPVTVSSIDLRTERAWTLPSAVPGGEVAVLRGAAPVHPVAYDLSGPTTVRLNIGDALFAAVQGLPAGSYSIEPVYENGPKGRVVTTSVEAGVSTILALDRENVGAVKVSGDPEMCGRALRFQLEEVLPTGTSGGIRRTVMTSESIADCHWMVSGLRPSLYEAGLWGVEGAAGRQRVAVAAQTVSDIRMEAPRVLVTGEIRQHGAPVAGADLQWMRRAGGPITHVMTDNVGAYRAWLDSPGAYRVTLTSGSMRAQVRQADLVAGENVLDWSVGGATIKIRLAGWDRTSPAVVEVKSPSSATSTILQPEDDPELTRSGIDSGTYTVSAYQQHGLSAKPVVVNVGETDAEITVDLRLGPSEVRLSLQDSLGRAVTGAEFPHVFPVPREVAPGVYAFTGISPGTPIRIRAPGGIVPTCRAMPADESADVTLETGTTARVQLPLGRDALRQLGVLVSLAGAECPVPFSDFFATRLPNDQSGAAKYLVHGLPAVRELVVDNNGQRRRATLADSGTFVFH